MYKTVQVLCPVELFDGANALAGVAGLTGAPELLTFTTPTHSLEGAEYGLVQLQCTQAWWDAVEELIAGERSLARPEWDVDNLVDMDAAASVLATAKIITGQEESLPDGLLLLDGIGIDSVFNLSRLEEEEG